MTNTTIMKKILFLLTLSILLFACTKEQWMSFYDTAQTLKPGTTSINITPDSNWCGMKVAAWGDSFTGSVEFSVPYTSFLAEMLGIDTRVNVFGALVGGSANMFNAGIGGEKSTATKARYDADTTHKKWATIIWTGRNDIFIDSAVVHKNILAMAKAVPHTKYFVIGIVNADNPQEWIGTPYHDLVDAFNASLATEFKTHYISPVLTAMNGSAGDSLDIAHGVTPRSLRADALHRNSYGNYLMASRIASNISICQ